MKQPTLYMAPIKGFTDYTYRNTFTEHFGGFDLAVSPFISSKRDNKIKKKYVKEVLPENNSRLPVIPQILSKTGKDFITLANYLYELGYGSVNWNLGCPYPTVAKKKRGSGMLPHTDMIHEFLDNVVPGIKGTLSIKIRLGWRSNDDIFRLIPILNQYPLEELIIHPRTGIQRYDGEVDLEAFGQIIPMINIPLVYSGDIRTFDDFKKLSQKFDSVSRWMIGRGCLANPFLPLIIKTEEDEIKDRILKIKQFHEALFEKYSTLLDGPSHVLNKMKGHWCYMSSPFTDCKKTMKKIKKSRRPDQYLELVNLFFETEAEWPNR